MLAELKKFILADDHSEQVPVHRPNKMGLWISGRGVNPEKKQIEGKDSVGDPIWWFFQMTKNSYKNMILITV